MDAAFQQQLLCWEKPFLRDQDLVVIFQDKESRRYDAVKYALKKGVLAHVKRGVYLIKTPYSKKQHDPFEIAGILYGPSYISLESALSFHGWIPEAVYWMTSVCAKRSKRIETQIGCFSYMHTPQSHFYLNVVRNTNRDDGVYLIAEPWKAIADMIYCHKKQWKSLGELSLDLRIERDVMEQSDRDSLLHIATHYDSTRVRCILSHFVRELF